jgi:hypothetical protein
VPRRDEQGDPREIIGGAERVDRQWENRESEHPGKSSKPSAASLRRLFNASERRCRY